MEFSFPLHVTLLERFLERREHILEAIEGRLLNVQGKNLARVRDPRYLEQPLASCFFNPIVAAALAHLRGQLTAIHRAEGFEPAYLEGSSHQFDPAQLVSLAYAYWTTSRWPGRNVRMAFSQTIFSVFMLRQLEQLSLRIWDDGSDTATARLQTIQRLLDRLNGLPGSPAFVSAAPWLIQVAQGALTRHLEPYFRIAEHISSSFDHGTRLEIQIAGALLAGGHLRSQLRYRAREMGRGIDDPAVLSVTRNSNSMDGALLIGDLVTLLKAYKSACAANDIQVRLTLADPILQGMSADPELFLVRLDVLASATMIEDVFIERQGNNCPEYTQLGHRHRQLLNEYRELISELAEHLRDDARRADPRQSIYSPFGIVYGFCADILFNMAASRLVSSQTSTLTLEEVFSTNSSLESRLAKAREWEALPRQTNERARFEHSTDSATEIFDHLIHALDARTKHGDALNASPLPSARLLVVQEGKKEDSHSDVNRHPRTMRAQEHCVTSDLQRALETGATAFPKNQILSDRNEGRFLASVESNGKWFAVSKVLLTMCVCQGTSAWITDVPSAAIDVLRLTCSELLESAAD